MGEKPENKITLTAEQISAAQEQIKKLLIFGQKVDADPETIAQDYELLKDDEKLLQMLSNDDDQAAYNYIKSLTQLNSFGSVFAIMELPDGSKKFLTERDFIEMMARGTDLAHPDADAQGILKNLLGAMLEYVKTRPELAESPNGIKTLENMQLIYDFLMQENPEDALEQFLQGQKAFMAVPRPAGIENLLKISAKDNGELTIKEFENGKITFSGRLAFDEQKVNEMIRIAFSNANHYKTKKGLNTLIELPFTKTMETLGRTNKKLFSRQLRKEMLPTIAHQYIEMTLNNGSFLHTEVGGGYYVVDVRKDKIFFKISDPYAAYLNTGALSLYSNKTLQLGSQKNPLPYYIATKLQDQYFHDGNRQKGTNCILAVKTLLSFCEDTLPSYEYVQKTDRGHWVDRIRKPLEAALNDIQDIELFNWQYCKKGLAEATPQEINTNDYSKWSSLYITFTLIPDEPDQSERLENKRKKIEEAQAKKAIKDAETMIKADKIQRRQERKKKKEAESKEEQ